MSFANIRTYIKDRIAIIDPDLIEQDDAFGDQDLANVQAEKFYKLVFGAAEQTNTAGNAYGLEISTILSIFDTRNRCEIDTFDELYTKAIQIRDEILNPCQVKNQADFSDLVGISITPSKEVDDDKTFRFDLEFNLRIDNYYS